MTRVQLVNVSRRFGHTLAVDRFNADIADGEFITLLGPSGCGKTTTLRMVAGLVEPSAGTILFDDQVMNGVPTNRRNIGLAFQSHALFPHLSVARNVAFGLEVKGTPKAEIKRRVDEMLAMVELSDYGDRLPSQLSGGQQQRVALARMLATDPRVLLFDEPLSALDRNLRDTLKYSILDLQRRTKKTAIYVTHDQSEAFAISDRIFVMNEGHIEQAGAQLDIYLRPQSEFVANFVGDNNSVHGTVTGFIKQEDGARLVEVTSGAVKLLAIDTGGLKLGDAAVAFVRPETIEVLQPGEQAENPYVLEGMVEQVVFEGPTVRLEVDVDGTPFLVEVGGLTRLRLIGADQKRIRIWPREVSAVRDREAVAA